MTCWRDLLQPLCRVWTAGQDPVSKAKTTPGSQTRGIRPRKGTELHRGQRGHPKTSNSGSCYHAEAGSIMEGNGLPLSRDQATRRHQNHREGCLKEGGGEPRRARAREECAGSSHLPPSTVLLWTPACACPGPLTAQPPACSWQLLGPGGWCQALPLPCQLRVCKGQQQSDSQYHLQQGLSCWGSGESHSPSLAPLHGAGQAPARMGVWAAEPAPGQPMR